MLDLGRVGKATLMVKRCFGIMLPAAAAMLAVHCVALAGEDLGAVEQQAFRAAVDRVAPCVVRIDTIGGRERVEGMLVGSGPTTGLIVDPAGYVISSAFNFLNQPASILVRLPDGPRKAAKLVATDHNRMLVLLKIDAGGPLPVPEIVPEKEIRVGQWAVAVGRAFESPRPNLSVGIVSALQRIWGKALQTDAAISPNNYGGPLVDLQGRVLGVLVPLSPDADDEMSGIEWYDSGIGFAISAEHVEKILPRLKQGEDLYRGVIGISFASPNLHIEQPVLKAVQAGSPAAKAGIRKGDRVVAIGGRSIERAAQVREELMRRYAGDKVEIVVARDAERLTREVPLVARLDPYRQPFLGVLPKRPLTKESATGVQVRYVYPASPAAKAGLRPGDTIVALAGHDVDVRDDVVEQLADLTADDEVPVQAERGVQKLKLTLKLARLPEAVPADKLPAARAASQARPVEGTAVGIVQYKVPELPNDVWMYVPETYTPDVPHGVLVWLGPAAGAHAKQAVERWRAAFRGRDMIVVVPQAGEPGRWQSADARLIQKLLERITEHYEIDEPRVVVGGLESGGTLACRLAFRFREQYRAVVAVEGPLVEKPAPPDPLHSLAFYVARSPASRQAGTIEEGVKRLRDLAYPVSIRDLAQPAGDLANEDLAELARWIDTLDRL